MYRATCVLHVDFKHMETSIRKAMSIWRSSERTREGNDLYMEMKESGVINEQNIAESKVAL